MSTPELSPAARKLLQVIQGCHIDDARGVCSVTTKGFLVWREHKLSRSHWEVLVKGDNHMESAGVELIKAGVCNIVVSHGKHELVLS